MDIKGFWERNKKKIVSVLVMVASVVALSVVAMLILWAFGVIYFNDGIQINAELFDSFKNAWYGWLIVLAIEVLITTVLCFIPGVSMAFILLLQAMYENPWHAFALAFIGVMLASLLMYLTGRFGGYRICEKLLGKEDCEKASQLLNNKGAVYFPIMMLFPMFPDEALTMVAGTLKMSLKWFVPSIVIGRGIGIASIVFGLGNIPYDKFTSIWHWVAFIAACAIVVVAVFYAAYRFNKFLEKRNNKQEK